MAETADLPRESEGKAASAEKLSDLKKDVEKQREEDKQRQILGLTETEAEMQARIAQQEADSSVQKLVGKETPQDLDNDAKDRLERTGGNIKIVGPGSDIKKFIPEEAPIKGNNNPRRANRKEEAALKYKPDEDPIDTRPPAEPLPKAPVFNRYDSEGSDTIAARTTKEKEKGDKKRGNRKGFIESGYGKRYIDESLVRHNKERREGSFTDKHDQTDAPAPVTGPEKPKLTIYGKGEEGQDLDPLAGAIEGDELSTADKKYDQDMIAYRTEMARINAERAKALQEQAAARAEEETRVAAAEDQTKNPSEVGVGEPAADHQKFILDENNPMTERQSRIDELALTGGKDSDNVLKEVVKNGSPEVAAYAQAAVEANAYDKDLPKKGKKKTVSGTRGTFARADKPNTKRDFATADSNSSPERPEDTASTDSDTSEVTTGDQRGGSKVQTIRKNPKTNPEQQENIAIEGAEASIADERPEGYTEPLSDEMRVRIDNAYNSYKDLLPEDVNPDLSLFRSLVTDIARANLDFEGRTLQQWRKAFENADLSEGQMAALGMPPENEVAETGFKDDVESAIDRNDSTYLIEHRHSILGNIVASENPSISPALKVTLMDELAQKAENLVELKESQDAIAQLKIVANSKDDNKERAANLVERYEIKTPE